MNMKIEDDYNMDAEFSMVGGCEEYSYANNSRIQEKAILKTKSLVEDAIKEIYTNLLPKKFVAADLGCSTGPNTFLVLSEITNTIDEQYRHLKQKQPEIQYYLNDLPSNDFNSAFHLLMQYEKQVKEEKGDDFVPYYVFGLPGNFYGRLFPSKSVHFFHSSYCLMWLSQVPQGLEGENFALLNKCSIYINSDSPSMVSQKYSDQFKKDFTAFLESRSKELIIGGRIILTFLGRKNSQYIGGQLYSYILLLKALNDMVSEGIVKEDKLNTFHMPFYAPLMEEVKSIIKMEGSFHLIQAKTFESNWDPFDESADNLVLDRDSSGKNVAKYTRAVMEPLLTSQFGDKIMDDLFSRYAKNVARHMSKGKPKFDVFILYLKLKDLKLEL